MYQKQDLFLHTPEASRREHFPCILWSRPAGSAIYCPPAVARTPPKPLWVIPRRGFCSRERRDTVSASPRLSARALAALSGMGEGTATSTERGARPRGRPRAGGVVYKEKASWGCSKPRSRQRMFTSLQTRVAEDTMLCERGRCPAMRVPMLVGIAKAPGRGRKPRGGL